MNASAMMEFLYAEPGIDPRRGAEFIDGLVWSCESDTSLEIYRTNEAWLESFEKPRIQWVFAQTNVFPFETKRQMAETLGKIARQYPDLAAECEKMIRERTQDYNNPVEIDIVWEPFGIQQAFEFLYDRPKEACSSSM